MTPPANPSALPASYRVQDGCESCIHAFGKGEHDEPTQFYCTLNAPKRPPCGSVAMNESCFDNVGYDSDAWMKWAEGRAVWERGICDSHEKGNPQ